MKKDLGWYLREWMSTLNLNQVQLAARTGWSTAATNLMLNGKQDFDPEKVAEAALALHIEKFELFMHPDDAMRMRRLKDTALQIAADNKSEYHAEPPDTEKAA